MEYISIIAIAVGLAMDAFAVSVATGIRLGCDLRYHHTARLAFSFGFFQFFMTFLGWLMGSSVEKVISSFDHWIAMGLLVIIGGKMIIDSLKSGEGEEIKCDPTTGLSLLVLSVSTSIDALAVGISLGVLHSGIWYQSIIIGIVAAAFTIAGMKLGEKIGILFSHRIEILGGLILIGIGLKIFFEHILAK